MLELRGIAATKTLPEDKIGSGLNTLQFSIAPNYHLGSHFGIYFEFEYTRFYDEFAKILEEEGESTIEKTYSFGISIVF